MAHDPITAALDLGGKVIDKLFPNKADADAAKVKLAEMHLNGELAHLAASTELSKGQLKVNEEEAKNSSLFVAGWRPAVGWTCVLGLFYTFFLRPMLGFVLGFVDVPAGSPPLPMPPELDMGELITLLFGMLGLGAIRMTEKIKGVASR